MVVALLPYLLGFLKHFFQDDGFLCVIKHGLVFFYVLAGLLVPNRVGAGLEVDRAARVFSVLQNVNDSTKAQNDSM